MEISEKLRNFNPVNITEKIKNTPIDCFFDANEFFLSIYDEYLIQIFLPLPCKNYDEFVNGKRASFVLPPDCYFEHEETIFIIRLNENGFPSGDWEECRLRVIEISSNEYLVPGISPGYSLVELLRQSGKRFNRPNRILRKNPLIGCKKP